MIKRTIHGQLINDHGQNISDHGQGLKLPHVTASSQSECSSPEEMALAHKQYGDRSLMHIGTNIQPVCLKTGHAGNNNTAIS